MNCTAGPAAPQPSRSGGREAVAWALTCLGVCALNTLAERRALPPGSRTLLRRPPE